MTVREKKWLKGKMMTVVWHVDGLKFPHNDLFEVTNFPNTYQ